MNMTPKLFPPQKFARLRINSPGPSGRSPAEIVGSNPTGGHGRLLLSIVWCHVEVSATSWSLVQRSPTDCGASLCVI